MTLIELYQLRDADGKEGMNARALLAQAHWFTVNVDFDPKTGEALPQALSAFLAKIARPVTDGTHHDRLWRVTEHVRPSVERLFRALSESPRREHALLPVHAVRELDATSFIKLSNRPGRNIREKLAGKPYLQAVRRFQSVNLPENRLLKTFLTRLVELLELRQDGLGEKEDELLPIIQSWLLSDAAHVIAPWDNLPPNNSLLSHRDYRRIWDAWRWLQTLDDDIARDFSQLEVRAETMRMWNEHGKMHLEGTHHFADMPVFFDYEKFEIRPWLSQLSFRQAARKSIRSLSAKEVSAPVCIDLAFLRPRYAATRGSPMSLDETYLWQQWKSDDESVDIELFNSDAAYLHPHATTISSTSLFFSTDNTLGHLDLCARAFASKLRKVFKSDTLIWLVPDFLNEFELEVTRRNLNARFPDAEPLPRSVAAVFEQVDYSKTKSEGFAIVVVDTIGGKTCATKLIARFDLELKKRVPETNGFYWERCPPVIISSGDKANEGGKEEQNYDIITVDGHGQWRDRIRAEKPPFFDPDTLKSDSRIGHFAFCINLTNSPVDGGICLHALQQRAGETPLWRDHVPELSIKVMKDGLYQRFHLVSRGTTVKPIRGMAVSMPVSKYFTLPAGKACYQFPLFRGENADRLGFSARLDSPAFPLKSDAVCELNLTFEYGADEPYKLIFEPLDKSFPHVRATWKRTEQGIITDAPAPGYPTPMSWGELRRMPKPHGAETRDMLQWVLSAIEGLDKDLFIRPKARTTGNITRRWGVDKNGKHFTLAYCDEHAPDVFIHENNFVQGLQYKDFDQGDKVSFELKGSNGKFTGHRVANPDYKEAVRCRDLDEDATKSVVKRIRKGLYVPFIQVWKDGRSIGDEKCPKDFSNAAKNQSAYLSGLLTQCEFPQSVQREILFLLACLHKNTTDDCVQWITEQVENDNIRDSRAVGFALGDVSEMWQQHIFNSLASKPNTAAIGVFAYAIWRERHFVERFALSELQMTLNGLLQRLTKINSVQPNGDEMKDNQIVREWVRAVGESLELLLGLLRTRASTNPEIKMLLQPHQKITKKFAKQVERVTEIIALSNVNLFSRVQLNIQKPAGDHTPDLLYALRLYLTGDDGANAIHITRVSDSDND